MSRENRGCHRQFGIFNQAWEFYAYVLVSCYVALLPLPSSSLANLPIKRTEHPKKADVVFADRTVGDGYARHNDDPTATATAAPGCTPMTTDGRSRRIQQTDRRHRLLTLLDTEYVWLSHIPVRLNGVRTTPSSYVARIP